MNGTTPSTGGRFFRRVFVRLSLLLAAGMVVLCAVTWRITQNWLRNNAHDHLSRVVSLASFELERSLDDPQRLAIETTGMRDRCGYRLTVIEPGGRVLADSDSPPSEMENHADRPEIISALAGQIGHHRRLSHSVGRSFVYCAGPIYRDARLIGVVRVAAPAAEIERSEAVLFQWIGAALAVALPITVTIAYFLARALARPVQHVSGLAERLATGDLNTKIDLQDDDEVGQVARALDHMRIHLADRIREGQQQRQDLEVTLGRLEEGVIATDREGRVLTDNAAARRILGATQPLFGKSLHDHLPVAALQRLWDSTNGIAAGETQREIAMTVQGEARTMSVSVIRVDLPGTPIARLLCLRDITDLARSIAMKADFVANASHELRTPVATIRAASDTLAADDLDAPTRARFLAVIDRAVDRLKNLTEDLMHLNRVESPSFEPVISQFDPRELFAVVASLFAPAIHAKQATLVHDCKVTLMGSDRKTIELILKNLVDNAVKFIPEGGRVSLRCTAVGRKVGFDVEDNGCGIPPAEQDRVFERFYQVDKSRSQSQGGTGLGLSIVKHAVNALDGELTLKSEPGAGTTVSFTVPNYEA